MNIIRSHATNNLCYQANQKMTPKGIIVHSTGANNPNLKRYVDCPNEAGVNIYGNHWNVALPEGRKVCVHAFVGYDKNHVVRVAEILPLDICCWGVGAIAYDKNGKEVSANSSSFHHYGPSYNYDPAYIQFEICEDDLSNRQYYNDAFRVAAEYCAYLCTLYDIDVENVIGHIEAYKRGYGSHHADREHWMKRFGENMDDFRERVSKLLSKNSTPTQDVKMSENAECNKNCTIHVGDLVRLSPDATYYDGKTIPQWVKVQYWYVKESSNNDRIVIDKNQSGTNSICSAVNAKHITVVKSSTTKPTEFKNDCPYLAKVTANSLNIRNGAGTEFGIVDRITNKGIYTIVDECEGKGASLWGKLKSGAGWISLDYVKKV